jgi:signal transduction histidine kinase
VLTLTDVTERAVVEKLKDQFVSTVSHELRTPLTSIHASLGLIVGGTLASRPDVVQRMLSIASSNTDRLIRIVNDLLDLQRLQQGGLALQRESCRVEALMRTAHESVAELAARAGIELVLQSVPGEIVADPDRIVQTLINLISNAIKFSSAGQTVRSTCRWLDAGVEFCVADEGVGIPSDKHEVIFNAFVQVDASDSREKGGTGLGLAISRAIVEQHGGRIWVESVPGQGSRFLFTIPALRAEGYVNTP